MGPQYPVLILPKGKEVDFSPEFQKFHSMVCWLHQKTAWQRILATRKLLTPGWPGAKRERRNQGWGNTRTCCFGPACQAQHGQDSVLFQPPPHEHMRPGWRRSPSKPWPCRQKFLTFTVKSMSFLHVFWDLYHALKSVSHFKIISMFLWVVF